MFNRTAFQHSLCALEALDSHVREALADADRLRAGLNLVVTGAAAVDGNQIYIVQIRVFEGFDNAVAPLSQWQNTPWIDRRTSRRSLP